MMNFDAEVSQLIGDLHAPDPQRNGTLVRLVGMR
jgi:flagellum-specific ATP synthase